MFIKDANAIWDGRPNRSVTGMSQWSYHATQNYPDRTGSSQLPGGDILDQ